MLLVGNTCFNWLRRVQERAPAPRVDLRYLVEGAITMLQANAQMEPVWMTHSREALVRHLAGPTAATISGTGRQSAEGAKARTSGQPAGHNRHDDCRALQIGEPAFQWLKGKQGTTRDPRLDMRYLVEGVLTLLSAHPELLPQVVSLARRSLRVHLAELETQLVEPFSLEKSQ
ncbi:MAG: hypothetical protein CFE45_01055 [Burkholderiales bacterium PBB5]|nr:MAG: hypothetical protein CFE45_01055 [Burkholderiales bacterium PBB5]